MNRYIHPATLILCFVAFVLMFTTSCSTSKKLNYFNDLPDAEAYELKKMPILERVIERGDRLDISFIVKDQESAAFFNKNGMAPAASAAMGAGAGLGTSARGGMGMGGGTAATSPAYEVDAQGEIEMPVVGKVKLAGLTTLQAKQKLVELVSPFLKDPLVEVSFTTFKVTVLGEVRLPGTFILSAQHATLFQALAAAGDLPHTAKRYDIRLFRDYNGKRTVRKFDLRKASVLEDPNIFQMRPNDVIYVQARSNSIFKEDFTVFASIVTIVLSALTLVTIRNNNN
ncbi:polysaccharide biosynthesis/export family protein [Longitalea luteola]|uniref:polysaccharide biosynthesis/export family protein n=1 Tax=Longitalea luteola TaxID=2812563 RepID=UPI001A97AE66|nr:polysaccharide biosynthesis/export family protein [Longitalea luteola]